MSPKQIYAARRAAYETLQSRVDQAWKEHGPAQQFEDAQRAAVTDFLAEMRDLDQAEFALQFAPSAQ